MMSMPWAQVVTGRVIGAGSTRECESDRLLDREPMAPQDGSGAESDRGADAARALRWSASGWPR